MKTFALVVVAAIAAAGQAGGLENGGVWRDTNGVHINAHGGGLLREGDTWYWYGEHKVEGKAGNRAQVGVGCYSSKDLLAWKDEGIALKVSETPGDDIERDCILERPKVVKAPATGKYVMLFHLERKGNGYGDARVGFAVADAPTGPFAFKYSCRPLDAMSRDMTVFTDDDGSVWHIFASESNSTLHFAELNGDCLGYSGKCHRVAEKQWTEAPAIIKRGGWYWLLGSGCTGWKPNAARIYRAKSLEGPWEWLGNPCTGVNPANKLGADKTWGGQSTYIFHDPVSGLDVACFDIWQPANAIDGRYVWLPIIWKGDEMPEIPWRGTWDAEKRKERSLVGGPNSEWGVYQWGVDVAGAPHKETKRQARAYLWIPPETKCVKAVVIGNDNMLEEPLFSSPDFRRTLASADVAIVFVTPGLQGFNEKFGEGDVPTLDALLEKLAAASGHPELAKDAKIVPLGHSAWADWPYLCTAAMPGRVACAVSLKGSWPHFKPQFDDAFWKKTEGVPMLLVGGDYEWFSERMDKEKNFLKSHPNVKLYPVADWESGHFDMTDALPLAIAEFIAKGTVPKIPRFGGKFCVVGFKDRDGKIVEQDPKSHLQVMVPFQPQGEGFRASACFDDKVPPGRPERWTGKKSGEENGRPELPREAIDVKVVQGPAVKTGVETFDIRFNRHGFDGYRAREVVLAAVYPGDAHWKRSVQQAILRFPVNEHGADNVVEWDAPKDAKVSDFPLKLDAKASSGLPVRYFVREGPAVVDDDVLLLCDWPVGAKECDITVCAYQWGVDGGKVKTAKPVYATIKVVASAMSAEGVVKAPDGTPVCRVSAPLLGAGASIETTNLTDGVAWRIRYDGAGERTISEETWTFDFGEDFKCWPVSHAQGEYVPKTLSTIADIKPMPDQYRGDGAGKGRSYEHLINGSTESPLVVEGKNFTAVMGDAGVEDYSRIRFVSGSKSGVVQAVLEGPSTVTLPYTTPWRYVRAAANCSALAQGQDAALRALNPPSRIADASWVKSGKVIRVAKLTTKSALETVEFAARNGFPYVELDSGWYGDERTADPLKPGLAPEKLAKGEELDIFKVIAAAKEKGIGVILYVNREPLKKNAEAIFDKLVEWGVVGVKFGFVNVGGQKWRRQVVDWVRMCADRKLMVDIHDEFRLAGLQNAWPNILTVEGIHGNEEMPCASHNAALVYTRFLDGPGDYTPCWKNGRVKNSLAHQLAMPCVYTSGWQFLFWYSRPDQIDENNPALDFWREIPTVFDETRFIDGKIGEFAVVARRVGKKWFVGCLNAGERRDFSIPLDFAGNGSLKVRLFRDANPDDAKPLGAIAVEVLSVSAKDSLKVSAASNGGWAAIVEAE